MKKLMIMLGVLLVVTSCNLKNKFSTAADGQLGIPKQPSVDAGEDNATTINFSHPEDVVEIDVTETATTEETDVDDGNPLWYYLIPFGGLGIIAFLVYRLKKQNMISEVH